MKSLNVIQALIAALQRAGVLVAGVQRSLSLQQPSMAFAGFGMALRGHSSFVNPRSTPKAPVCPSSIEKNLEDRPKPGEVSA